MPGEVDMKLKRYRQFFGVMHESDSGSWCRVEEAERIISKLTDSYIASTKRIQETCSNIISNLPFEMLRGVMLQLGIDETKIRQAEEQLRNKLTGGTLH